MNVALAYCLLAVTAAEPLAPGSNSTRSLQVDGRERSYIVHMPTGYDATKPTAVVLIFHGAFTNAAITVAYSGLNATADDKNFIAVYPNGTGQREPALFWNAGDWGKARLRDPPDDVKFVAAVLDDLAKVANTDAKRIYATGISNGGMMCYKLAAELSTRIAAIAPIAGTQSFENAQPKRPVPVLHFHGTEDKLVPYDGPKLASERLMGLKSVDDTVRIWAKLNACPEKPKIESLPDKADDGTTVRRLTYGPGKDGSEVVLIEIKGGGHSWPGRSMPLELFGRSTKDISANDMLWEFFQRHPLQ